MSIYGKFEARKQELKGKAEEAIGKATGDSQEEVKDRIDQAVGNLKQAGESAKDAFRAAIGDDKK